MNGVLDRVDSAVHLVTVGLIVRYHVGGSNDVCSSLDIRKRDFGESLDAFGVVEETVGVYDAAMTVGCVGAETHVTNDEERWKVLFQGFDGSMDATFLAWGIVNIRE